MVSVFLAGLVLGNLFVLPVIADANTSNTYVGTRKTSLSTRYTTSRTVIVKPTSPVSQPEPAQTAPTPEPTQTTPSPEPTPSPAPSPVQIPESQPFDIPVSNPNLEAMEKQMVDLINYARIKAGQKPLEVHPGLTISARIKSNDMAINNYYSHVSPTWGGRSWGIIGDQVAFRDAGENLHKTSSVTRAHAGFMASPTHKINILKSNYTHVGIGIVPNPRGGYYFTQHFIQIK